MAFQRRTPKEPTDAELFEAAEMMDAGLRLAFPQLFEPEPEAPDTPEPISHEEAKEAGAGLMEMKAGLKRTVNGLALKGNVDIHLGLNALEREIDRISGELAERWST